MLLLRCLVTMRLRSALLLSSNYTTCLAPSRAKPACSRDLLSKLRIGPSAMQSVPPMQSLISKPLGVALASRWVDLRARAGFAPLCVIDRSLRTLSRA